MKIRARIAAFAVAAACLATGALAAAASHKTAAIAGIGGSGEVILIVQIALLLLVGRGLGEVMQRIGQPAVIGQLLAGLILGPSLLGWVWPDAHALIFPDTTQQKNLIAGISDIGVMMLLLLTGMETDIKLARQVGTPAVTVAMAGIAVPFVCGCALALALPASLLPSANGRLVAALFLGTALSISSIKIVAMIVRELNFMRRNLGQIIVASAIMEDTAGWVIISLTLAISGAGVFAPLKLAGTVAGTAVFLVISYTLGRRWVFQLIKWVNDSFVSEYAVVSAILLVMCVLALITQAIGVNTVLGAFVAGVLVGQSPILSQHIEDQLRGLITAFMMPVFFGLSGLSADLTILKQPSFALLAVGLILVASVGKFGGAFLGGRLGGLSRRESLALGCAMNARGSTEVIVATIGLSMGALTRNLYSLIVTMAVVTTMTMPPMLRWALKRLPKKPDEEARLEREEIDAKGFVSRFERLLIAADESDNGRFATRIAGFIAGQRGIPLTVLKLDAAEGDEQSLRNLATEGAKKGHRAAMEEKGEGRQIQADISARAESPQDNEAVTREGDKGYDLLFVGLSKMRNANGKFSTRIDQVASGFEGPIALTFSRGARDEDEPLRILVPVNGTETSRQGAELAFALHSAKESRITLLYVSERRTAASGKGPTRRKSARNATERAVLDDVLALARRYGHEEIATAIHNDVAPEDAIIDEADQVAADLIVIGANRRVGDFLYLGETVEQVLKLWNGSLVLVG